MHTSILYINSYVHVFNILQIHKVNLKKINSVAGCGSKTMAANLLSGFDSEDYQFTRQRQNIKVSNSYKHIINTF